MLQKYFDYIFDKKKNIYKRLFVSLFGQVVVGAFIIPYLIWHIPVYLGTNFSKEFCLLYAIIFVGIMNYWALKD